jgi:hypothetical protein
LHELGIQLGNVVQHHNWSGKDCPKRLRHPSSKWEAFLLRVQEFYNQFNLDSHEHDHPMNVVLAALAPLAGGLPGISLSWEDDSHPFRKQWSQQLAASVQQHKARLEQGDPNGFIVGYSGLALVDQIRFWGELFVAISKFESSWNPNNVFHESDGQNSVGLLQLSVGDQNNYNLTPHVNSELGLKDPLVNINWAVAILAHWTAHDRLIATGVAGDNRGGARYWSVLRGGPSHHYLEIKALTKMHSGLA